jgi:hypothetical protein
MAAVTTISCDECVMRRTAACLDCVVTYLYARHGDDTSPDVELSDAERRAVELFACAGLVPRLRFELVS